MFNTRRGQVVIVIEGKPGANGATAGSALMAAPPDGRPDLQTQSTGRLGDGRRTVCDENGDGVPAINPPTFDPANDDVTDALLDFACRFQVFTPAAPCTYTDASGDPRLVDPTARIQFCDFMSATASFHPGVNVLTAVLRGVDGVLGPTAQIVVRVATPTPTPR